MTSRKKRWIAWVLVLALVFGGAATAQAAEAGPDAAAESAAGESAPAEDAATPTPEESEPEDNIDDTTGEAEDAEPGDSPEEGGEEGEAPAGQPEETPGESEAEPTPEQPAEEPEETPAEEEPEEELPEEDLDELLPEIGLEGEESPTGVIGIGSVEELGLIGNDEAYPLDGEYELLCDLYGGELEPIGSEEAPFTGVLYGNGHIVAGLRISGESAGLFGGLSGRVCDLTLADISVDGERAGILAGWMQDAAISNVLVCGEVSGETIGAIAGEAKNCDLSKVIYFTADKLDAVGKGKVSALMLRSQPAYIAIVMSQTARLAADGTIGHFAFDRYEGDEGFTLEDSDAAGTLLVPTASGRFTLTAVYCCEVEGEAVELRVEIPVIIGVDAGGLNELSTLDGVFYEQLGDYEVVQISALEPLQLLEGVFAETILQEQQTAVPEETPINKITTWEQFKNIGNTDFDPNYTMCAVYLLDADIASDGEPFEPIGTEDNPFYGEFDGRTFTIDLALNPEIDTDAEYCGLFGVVLPPEGEEADEADSDLPEEMEEIEESEPEAEISESEPEEVPEEEELSGETSEVETGEGADADEAED